MKVLSGAPGRHVVRSGGKVHGVVTVAEATVWVERVIVVAPARKAKRSFTDKAESVALLLGAVALTLLGGLGLMVARETGESPRNWSIAFGFLVFGIAGFISFLKSLRPKASE